MGGKNVGITRNIQVYRKTLTNIDGRRVKGYIHRSLAGSGIARSIGNGQGNCVVSDIGAAKGIWKDRKIADLTIIGAVVVDLGIGDGYITG